MFFLEPLLTDGIAQLSYLVGDTSTGHAAVIDPRTDVEVYETLARKHGVSITHIFETHIHADFVSGSRSLAERIGTAKIRVSGVRADYKFEGEPSGIHRGIRPSICRLSFANPSTPRCLGRFLAETRCLSVRRVGPTC